MTQLTKEEIIKEAVKKLPDVKSVENNLYMVSISNGSDRYEVVFKKIGSEIFEGWTFAYFN